VRSESKKKVGCLIFKKTKRESTDTFFLEKKKIFFFFFSQKKFNGETLFSFFVKKEEGRWTKGTFFDRRPQKNKKKIFLKKKMAGYG
jgi:hypothetical protein